MNARGAVVTAGAAALLWALSATAGAQAAPRTTATITVVVPTSTPRDSALFIAGSALTPAWQPNGLRIQRQDDGRYSVTLQLTVGSTLEYKFTRGSWTTVEKTASGADIPNRRLRIEPGVAITDTVGSWGTGSTTTTPIPSTRVGQFVVHERVPSTHLTNPRTVIVYLPPHYADAARAGDRYPVLYMHDGQNLFDRATAFGGNEWQMDETAERLINEGKIRPLIIVGIYNTGARMTEYTPVGATPAPGKSGDDYTAFVVDELKPFIDKSYRTKPDRDNTAIAGSSLGGLISLSMAISHPETFSKAGVISASLFWNDGQMLKESAAHPAALKQVKFWVDIGTKEGGTAAGDTAVTAVLNARRLIDVFRGAGLATPANYFYLEVPNGEHNETWWAKRMDQMLVFFFGVR